MNTEDRAQEIELAEYERTQRRAIMTLPTAPSAKKCAACNARIPKARRQAVPGVLFCTECQQRREYENNNRRGR